MENRNLGGAGVGPPYLRRVVTKRPGFHPQEDAESFFNGHHSRTVLVKKDALGGWVQIVHATINAPSLLHQGLSERRSGLFRDPFSGKRDDPGQGLPSVPRGNAVVDHKRKGD